MDEEELPELWGIKINGFIHRSDEQHLNEDDFFDKFAEVIEAQGWLFGGTFKQVDLNHPPNGEI